MRKRLESGTLWWLLKQMPPALKLRLNEELEKIDADRKDAHQKGDTRITSMVQHLRWVAEDQAELVEMRYMLFSVLNKYLPLTNERMLKNELPTLSDCTYFWGRLIKNLEREAAEIV